MVSELLDTNRPRIDQTRLDISFETGKGVPDIVMADPLRLRQILQNLLNNAMKFTSQGYIRLTIATEPAPPQGVQPAPFPSPEGTYTTLTFSTLDSGIGIPEEHHARIFDHFTQADGSMTRKYGGTGLGLSICRQLVEAMGGQIGLESRPGQGSRFYFTLCLPCLSADSQYQPQKTPQQKPSDKDTVPGQALNVLLVEDDPPSRVLTSKRLKRAGHCIDSVTNGKEALETLRNNSYDVVLMDLQMPVMDGLETTEAICKAFPPSKQPIIIAITAHAFEEDRKNCIRAGMKGFLTKPVNSSDMETLLQKIHHTQHSN
jgi:CheY-like chemotaxis protein